MPGKIARKYMAHFLDTSFTINDLTPDPSYYRLGKDLEEYTVGMNPDVTVFKNIIGQTNMTNNGYERSSSAEPFYAEVGDPLFAKLQYFVEHETQDDDLKTYICEVHLWDSAGTNIYTACRQPCYVVPTSYGGDTSGYQIPFDIHYVGTREAGYYNVSNNTFSTTLN